MNATSSPNTGKKDLPFFFAAVRAIAIVWIYSFHLYDYSHAFGSVGERRSEGILPNLFGNARNLADYASGFFQLMFAFGDLGVHFFIIASGFGIYLSYLRNKPRWASFYKKRAVRILPLYWTALILIYLFSKKPVVSTGDLVNNLLLIQIFTENHIVFGPLWFVSYIVGLYLLFPLIVKAFGNVYTKWALFLSSFFLTWIYTKALGILGFQPVGVPITMYLDMFLIGMLLAESYHRGKSLHSVVFHPAVTLISLLTLGAVIYLVSFTLHYNQPLHDLIGVLFFLSLPLPLYFFRNQAVFRKITGFVAYASYVVFLIHVDFFIQTIRHAYKARMLETTVLARGIVWLKADGTYVTIGVGVFFVILFLSYGAQRLYDYLVKKYLPRYA